MSNLVTNITNMFRISHKSKLQKRINSLSDFTNYISNSITIILCFTLQTLSTGRKSAMGSTDMRSYLIEKVRVFSLLVCDWPVFTNKSLINCGSCGIESNVFLFKICQIHYVMLTNFLFLKASYLIEKKSSLYCSCI